MIQQNSFCIFCFFFSTTFSSSNFPLFLFLFLYSNAFVLLPFGLLFLSLLFLCFFYFSFFNCSFPPWFFLYSSCTKVATAFYGFSFSFFRLKINFLSSFFCLEVILSFSFLCLKVILSFSLIIFISYLL